MMDPPGGVEGKRLLKKPTTGTGKTDHHEALFRPKQSLSQDNLQLRALFDRLESIPLDPSPHHQAPQNRQTAPSLAAKLNVRCSCGNVNKLSSSQGQSYQNGIGPVTSAASSDADTDFDGDDDDDDDEPFSLVALVGLLVAQERKGSSARQHGAIKNLAASCRGDRISDNHLHQLVHLTSSSDQQVRLAAFLALRQAATNDANAKGLLQMGIVPQLLSLLQDKMEAPCHATAAAILEKVVMHRKLTDHWLEKMITRGLSILIGCLTSANQAPETKVALGQLLSNLACFFEIAVLLLDHCMEDVMEIWLRYPYMKESLTDLFGHLVQHTDHTIAGVLEHRVVDNVAPALREGSCCVQIKGVGFFLALCSSEYGMSALLDDRKLGDILQVLRATHCRRLRELCVATLTKILQRATPNKLREVVLQTESAFSEGSATEGSDLDWKDRKGEPGHMASRKKDVGARSDRGIRVLINILVEIIHKEAKITLDQTRKVRTVGFRPGLDFFKTLSDTVLCMCYVATVTVGRQRNRTSSHNSRVSLEGSKARTHKLNSAIVQFMFQQGALCVLDLLNTYTVHLFPQEHSPTQQQRNLDILHLQAMMKVWQMAPPPKQGNPLPSQEELQFVQRLMECVQLYARCSSEFWNSKLEKEVESMIQEYSNWRGELETAETIPSRHYQYVKTVDQAFPSSYKVENVTSHRQELIEIRERQINESRERQMKSVQQRRMAWGDQNDRGVARGERSDHPSSKTPSGDSVKSTMPKRTRPSSAKKEGLGFDKFDLSESVFTKSSPSTKQREQLRVKRNVRTVGYTGKAPVVTTNVKEEKSAIDADEKELHRKLRTRLFQEGICETVGPWLACQVPEIQTLAAACLRCVIQPLHPEEIQQLRESAEAKERQNRHKSRSEMAKTLAERDKILSQVLGQMSAGSADVVRDALKIKGQSEKDSSKTGKGLKFKTKPPLNAANHKPASKSDEPIGWQCSIHLLEACGSQILKGLDSDSPEVKRASLLFLYDLVTFGETVVHMKLASLGTVSQLMDFLRSNVQTQDTALIGVMTLKNLISDYRLKQIFCSEGGEAFLRDLIKTSEGALQMHLHRFLKSITEGPGGLL